MGNCPSCFRKLRACSFLVRENILKSLCYFTVTFGSCSWVWKWAGWSARGIWKDRPQNKLLLSFSGFLGHLTAHWHLKFVLNLRQSKLVSNNPDLQQGVQKNCFVSREADKQLACEEDGAIFSWRASIPLYQVRADLTTTGLILSGLGCLADLWQLQQCHFFPSHSVTCCIVSLSPAFCWMHINFLLQQTSSLLACFSFKQRSSRL